VPNRKLSRRHARFHFIIFCNWLSFSNEPIKYSMEHRQRPSSEGEASICGRPPPSRIIWGSSRRVSCGVRRRLMERQRARMQPSSWRGCGPTTFQLYTFAYPSLLVCESMKFLISILSFRIHKISDIDMV
jgi:hypothetical protein